jgi:hypothetical protein
LSPRMACIGRSLPDQRTIVETVHGRRCVQFKTQWDIRVGSGIHVLPTLVRTPRPWRTVRSLVCGTKIPGFGQVGSSGQRNVPGSVCERPRGDNLACSGARWRSMVATLIETNRAAPTSVMVISPSRRQRGTTVANSGARRLPVGVRVNVQLILICPIVSRTIAVCRTLPGESTV